MTCSNASATLLLCNMFRLFMCAIHALVKCTVAILIKKAEKNKIGSTGKMKMAQRLCMPSEDSETTARSNV